MVLSYKKLWKLLIDRDLNKTSLQKMAGISSVSLAKLSKNENVTTDILVKVCNALKCDFSDIMEMEEEPEKDLFQVVENGLEYYNLELVYCDDENKKNKINEVNFKEIKLK